jgi:hypothetical protein
VLQTLNHLGLATQMTRIMTIEPLAARSGTRAAAAGTALYSSTATNCNRRVLYYRRRVFCNRRWIFRADTFLAICRRRLVRWWSLLCSGATASSFGTASGLLVHCHIVSYSSCRRVNFVLRRPHKMLKQ